MIHLLVAFVFHKMWVLMKLDPSFTTRPSTHIFPESTSFMCLSPIPEPPFVIYYIHTWCPHSYHTTFQYHQTWYCSCCSHFESICIYTYLCSLWSFASCVELFTRDKLQMFTLMLQTAPFSFMLTPMPLGWVIPLNLALSHVRVSFLDPLILHGNPRSRLPSLNLVLNQNFEPLPLLLLKLFEFVGS